MEKAVLGIDIGTGSCKCCLVTQTGEILAEASTEYAFDADAYGTARQNPDEWYHALIKTLKQLVASGADLKAVLAATVTGQMRGVTLIGNDNKPAASSILWNDTTCEEEAELLNNQYDKMLSEKTLNPLNSMCSLPKILRLKNKQPEIWGKTKKWLYPKDYINFRLTGVIATDHSDASGSSIYDFSRSGWSPEIIKTFDLEADKFPQIMDSFINIGNITDTAAKETGLPVETPVIIGGSDATVELFAAGVTGESQCKIRLGSSCGISTVVKRYDSERYSHHYCWSPVTGEGIVLDINTRFCAQSVKWLRDVFYSELPKTGETYQLIDREAAAISPGAEGLIFHPYLKGEDAPYWNTALRGRFSGINLEHKRAHFARAVFEGIAFSIRDVLETYPEVYQGKSFHMIGGGIKSPTWLQCVVDIIGKPAVIPKSGEAAYGAGLIAWAGLKDIAPEAVYSISNGVEKTVMPDKKNSEVYDRQFRRYREIALNEISQQM